MDIILPEGFRSKLAFLFILQGLFILALSFTHSYAAIISTLMLLGIVFALITARALSTYWREQASDSLGEESPKVRPREQYSAELRKMDERRKGELEEELNYIKSLYCQMEEDVRRQKTEIKDQNMQLEIKTAELEKEKNKIEVILSSVPDGVITINLDRKISSWNPGAHQITDWTGLHAKDKHYGNILKLCTRDGKPLSEDDSPVEECFRTGSVVDRTGLFLKTRLNKEKPIDISIVPILDEKEVLRVVVVFRDISKKWEIEKLKEEFLAMVTHDLKSPLAAIVGYTNLLLHPKAQFPPEQQKSFLTSILGSVKILQFLIDNILESARLESGRIVYQFENFDMCSLLTEIEIMFTPLLNSKKLVLELVSESLWVHGDREKLREVINNIVSNAIKFTPEGGRITITSTSENDQVVIKIADTGKGIPSGELPKLFNKFVQVKGEKRGTGLGLYIVKRILEDHGQTINVTSQLGKGTEFTFTLKTGTPKDVKDAQSKAPVKMKGKRKGKVLIVEDNPEVSNLIKHYLREAGYESVQAFQGNDVPILIEKEKPDLITLDYNLPDINGEEVIKRMNDAGRKVNIPIIIITSSAKENWEIPYRCQFLKPLDEVRFLEEVDKIFARGASAMEAVEILH